MTTKRILCFHDSRVARPELFQQQVLALNRWMDRAGLDITFELIAQPFSGSQFTINPIYVKPSMTWDTMAINYGYEPSDDLNGASIGCDGNTGFPVITGMKIARFAEFGTPEFTRQMRVLMHEMQHIYSPLEGYHLLVYGDNPPAGMPDLSWDWRLSDPTRHDTGGIFWRNRGLRQNPAVDTTSDFELASMDEFHRQLWMKDVRQPWAWSDRGWFEPTVWTSDKPDLPQKLDTTRSGRLLVHRESNQVFDISEFLLHDLMHNRMTLPVVLPKKTELIPPTIDKPPVVINPPPAPKPQPPVVDPTMPAPATQPVQLANMRKALLKSRQLTGSLVHQLVEIDEALQALEANQDK